MSQFNGEIEQIPPMVSAIHYKGKRLYELARQGIEVERAPRKITIYKLELRSFDKDRASFVVSCSKGTYIRTLCADLGEVLQAGAHLTKLVRTRSGRFTLDHAVTLGRLAELAAADGLDEVQVSMDNALADFPFVTMNDLEAGRIRHGNSISWQGEPQIVASLVRMHDASGSLLALGKPFQGDIKPEIVFS